MTLVPTSTGHLSVLSELFAAWGPTGCSFLGTLSWLLCLLALFQSVLLVLFAYPLNVDNSKGSTYIHMYQCNSDMCSCFLFSSVCGT